MMKSLRFLLVALVLPFAGKAQLSADAGVDTKLCAALPYNSTLDTVRLNGAAVGGVSPYTYRWVVYDTIGGQQLSASTYLDDSTLAQPIVLRNMQNTMQTADRDSIVAILQVTDGNSMIATDTAIVRYQRIFACVEGYPVYYKNTTDTIQILDANLPGNECIENYTPLTFLYWTAGNTLVDSTVSAPRSFTTKPYETDYAAVVQDAIGCMHTNGVFGVFNNPTAIAKVMLKDALQIFPQPAIDVLTVTADRMQLAAVSVYSIDGRVLCRAACNGTLKTDVATGNLPTGSYLLEVRGADGQVCRQLIAVRH